MALALAVYVSRAASRIMLLSHQFGKGVTDAQSRLKLVDGLSMS